MMGLTLQEELENEGVDMPAVKKSQWKVELCIPDAMCSDVASRLKSWGVNARAWPCIVADAHRVNDGVMVSFPLTKHNENEATRYVEWLVTNFATWYRKDDIVATYVPTTVLGRRGDKTKYPTG